jgi:hypothetical protein
MMETAQNSALDVEHVFIDVRKFGKQLSPVIEEGDRCPDSTCKGTLTFQRDGSCSCHVHPPCGACVNSTLTCNVCGWAEDEPLPAKPNPQPRENALAIAVKNMGITRTDQIIPGRGEPYVDPTTGDTHLRFLRDGQEYHLYFKLEKSV